MAAKQCVSGGDCPYEPIVGTAEQFHLARDQHGWRGADCAGRADLPALIVVQPLPSRELH